MVNHHIEHFPLVRMEHPDPKSSGIQYEGGSLSFIQTEEGRAVNNSGSYNYEYHLTDHLGNSRVSFDTQTGSARQVPRWYPVGPDVPSGPKEQQI